MGDIPVLMQADTSLIPDSEYDLRPVSIVRIWEAADSSVAPPEMISNRSRNIEQTMY